MHELLAVAVLAGLLAVAVAGARGWQEAAAAVAAVAVVLGAGLVGPASAVGRAGELLPTLGFLAAILALAHLADAEGVFDWLGTRLAAAAGGGGTRLLACTFGAAAATTAVLSLDATVVLLTPVVLATARRLGVPPRPHLYACVHLANSASLLLPVSNLTNLLAVAATGLGFLQFTGLMVLPWLAVLAVELLVLRAFFADELRMPAQRPGHRPATRAPVFALAVLAAVLACFAAGSALGVAPAWAALAGVVVLGARSLLRGTVTVRALLASAAPGFLVFVLGLAVVVQAVTDHGLGAAVAWLLPGGQGPGTLLSLLGTAGVAAVLANLVNNLPATLLLLQVLGQHPGAGPVLALLLGVNIGPNACYLGSLATLLWRRVLRGREVRVRLGEFTAVGLLTTPACLLAGVLALWLVLRW